MLSAATPARAVDGFVVSIHYQADGLGNIHDSVHPGKLLRYDIKADKPAGTRVLDDKGDVTGACLSPFGDQIALTKTNGAIAVMSSEGGPEIELGRFTDNGPPSKDSPSPSPAGTGIQWPASEGGKWIYYLDARNHGANNTLRRVNIATKRDEVVVHFNRSAAGGFALSMNATPTTGFLAKRTDNYVIALYDISRGDGDLFNCERTYGCGESISPDGSLVTANAGTHAEVSLVDMTARKRHGFRVSQWDGDPTKGLPREKMEWAWQSFRWSVNSMNWISVTQGKLKLDSTYETFFQDAMLYDWVNQKQINVTGNKTGSFDRPAGFWEIGGKEFFLGSFSGKAPLTVELSNPRLKGEVEWDFGDGHRATAAPPTSHTFAKAGSYAIRGKQGGAIYQSQVQVLKQRPPSAVCRYVGGTCLEVDFDEPVCGSNIQAQMQSGNAAASAAERNGSAAHRSLERAAHTERSVASHRD